MPGYRPLPAEFIWRDDGDRLVLTYSSVSLAHVQPARSGWVVRTLLHQIEQGGVATLRVRALKGVS